MTSGPTGDASIQVTCAKLVGIKGDTAQNKLLFSGGMSCTAPANLYFLCHVVHRHSLYWHSHTGYEVGGKGYTGYLFAMSEWVSGTNGDTYKTHCNYWLNGSSYGSNESSTTTL